MQNQATTTTTIRAASISKTSSRLVQLGAAFMLGVVMLSGAVAVQMPAVHNAAHDMRHSQGFPCH